MSIHLTADLRQRLLAVDDHACAYCQTLTANTGQLMTVDHIIPQSQEGITAFENLCFACRNCNQFKKAQTTAIDPASGEKVALFNPRGQKWSEHFEWDNSGLHLIGRTPIGRATRVALKINNEVILDARRRWVRVGWHPPHS